MLPWPNDYLRDITGVAGIQPMVKLSFNERRYNNTSRREKVTHGSDLSHGSDQGHKRRRFRGWNPPTYQPFGAYISTFFGSTTTRNRSDREDFIRLLNSLFVDRPAPTITRNSFQGLINLSIRIENADNHEEIFEILNFAGHHKIAKRLAYLHEIPQDDDPDYSDPDMELKSLRKLALFFTSDGFSLPDPRIGISHNGLLQAEWYSRDAAALLNFMPDGEVVFAATLTNDDQDGPRAIHGTAEKRYALQTIRPFINQPY